MITNKENTNKENLIMELNKIIDIRSDTVTKPTDDMRQVIANAIVGDDVWGDDPTVNELQNMLCELSGKEAALFVPSGTMSNQIAIASATNSGDEIICESQAHIVRYEAGAPGFISRVNTKQISTTDGRLDLNAIIEEIRPLNLHYPLTKMICLENTHNYLGGRILPLDYIKEVESIAKEHKIHLHCDGARLWNASAATGISIKDYSEPFDSVSLCLSKGLGAPIGSVLVGSNEFISKAKRFRKILGGGMRQVGIIASAGIYAIKEHFKLLPVDHNNAKIFAQILSKSNQIEIDLNKVETNIVFFSYPIKLDQEKLINTLKQKNILIGAAGKNSLRAVFHLQVNEEEAIFAGNQIVETIKELMN